MPRSPDSFDPSEPRSAQSAAPFKYPFTSNVAADGFAIASAMFASLAMMTRYPVYVYLGFLCSIAAVNNTKRMDPDVRSTAISGWSGVMFVLTAALSVYAPIILNQAKKAPWSFSAPFPIKLGGGTIPRFFDGVPTPVS